jgi:hypothetical protein
MCTLAPTPRPTDFAGISQSSPYSLLGNTHPKTIANSLENRRAYPYSVSPAVFMCQWRASGLEINEQIQRWPGQSFDAIWQIVPSDKTP